MIVIRYGIYIHLVSGRRLKLGLSVGLSVRYLDHISLWGYYLLSYGILTTQYEILTSWFSQNFVNFRKTNRPDGTRKTAIFELAIDKASRQETNRTQTLQEPDPLSTPWRDKIFTEIGQNSGLRNWGPIYWQGRPGT